METGGILHHISNQPHPILSLAQERSRMSPSYPYMIYSGDSAGNFRAWNIPPNDTVHRGVVRELIPLRRPSDWGWEETHHRYPQIESFHSSGVRTIMPYYEHNDEPGDNLWIGYDDGTLQDATVAPNHSRSPDPPLPKHPDAVTAV
jgi:hypothetical protein